MAGFNPSTDAMDVYTLFCWIAIGLCGLCLGSFATALIYRIPRNIPWIIDSPKTSGEGRASRSQCPNCGHKLGLFDLIPLFSWLLSAGKCRYCRQKISVFYPAIELISLVLTLLLYLAWGPVWMVIPVILTVPILLSALIIDWEHMILPDDLNISFAILAALYLFVLGYEHSWDQALLINHLLTCLILPSLFWLVSFILEKIKNKKALGLGDLKFLPSAGIFLGMAAMPTFLGVSGVLGLITAFVKGRQGKGGEFPFGPALIISFYIHLFLTGLGFDYTW